MERNRGEYRKGAAEPSHTVECVHTHCQQNPVTLWHVCTHCVSRTQSHCGMCAHTLCQQNPVTLWHVCTHIVSAEPSHTVACVHTHTVSAEPSHTVTCEHTHCVSPLTSVEEHEANDRLFYVHLELVPTEDDALDDDPVWVHRQE